MVTGNTETLITVTYQDATADIDFVVDNDLANYSNATSAFITDITGDNLSALADATITSIAAGELLEWSGSAWVNQTLAELGLSETSHTHTQDPTNAEIEDLAGGLFSGNTETGITATYQAADNTLDLVVDSEITTFFGATDLTGAQAETLSDGSDADSLHTHGAIQTDEEVSDVVGGMVTGNTETRITVTYQDADNTLDFVVDDVTDITGQSGEVVTGAGPDGSDYWRASHHDSGDSFLVDQWDNSASAFIDRFEIVGKGTGLTNEGDFVFFDLDGVELARWDDSQSRWEWTQNVHDFSGGGSSLTSLESVASFDADFALSALGSGAAARDIRLYANDATPTSRLRLEIIGDGEMSFLDETATVITTLTELDELTDGSETVLHTHAAVAGANFDELMMIGA
jgi:hypothetical protein